MNNYYPEAFPSFWRNLERLVGEGRVRSTREVYRELKIQSNRVHTLAWAERNKHLFSVPDAEEMQKVAEILSVPHFQSLISQKSRLKGTPVADPFVIAAAIVHQGTVVTEEQARKNAAKIPNVCTHFEIECVNLADFITRQDWKF